LLFTGERADLIARELWIGENFDAYNAEVNPKGERTPRRSSLLLLSWPLLLLLLLSFSLCVDLPRRSSRPPCTPPLCALPAGTAKEKRAARLKKKNAGVSVPMD